MFFCLDQFIIQYGLSPPFLDVGCGIGDLSKYLALKGWQGKAIDFSDIAVCAAKQNLASFPYVRVEQKSLFEENENFKTIFLWDILEHIENDNLALDKVSSLLSPDGHVLIAVPSNPREWRWDDVFYGHYRRYSMEEIRRKIVGAGLEPLVFWDFTYPIFWIMRRIYTTVKPPPKNMGSNKQTLTKISPTVDAYEMGFISRFLSQDFHFWRLIYKLQFFYFKHNLEKGHEMFVLAKKS